MLLWMSLAFLAASVAVVLMRRRPDTIGPVANPDLDVYRDQITEIEHDAERGTIDAEQAIAARAEVGRRLLRQAEPVVQSGGKPVRRVSAERVLMWGAAAVPVVSLALYLAVGSPAVPGRPLAARLAEAPDKAAPTDMIAKVEARLREKPDDGQGWSVIAPVYLGQGRALEAADAYARAIKFAGENPDRVAGLAKSHVLASNGIVNEPARKAYERLAIIDPTRVEAKFWLALADEQNGRPDLALAAYRALLASAPQDAPWRASVEERIAAVSDKTARAASEPAGKPAPPVLAQGPNPSAGPTPAEFVAAAQKLAPEMREAMIGGKMIPKARQAVSANPKDVAAWSRIVTGLMALGKSAEARTSLVEARNALTGDAPALAELESLAQAFGLNS
jgi:cytochrome c-type biogenesis protein CcmH